MKAIDSMSKRELHNEVAFLRHNIKISGGLKCPNCDDEGYTPEQDGYGYWYQQQCEFCYSIPDSIFERNDDRDLTPWCHICRAMEQKECGCGPYAENH